MAYLNLVIKGVLLMSAALNLAPINPNDFVDPQIFVEQLENTGFSGEGANDALSGSDDMDMSPDAARIFQEYLQNDNGGVDVEKTKAFSHVRNVLRTLDSYDGILAERADNTDNRTKLDDLEKAIRIKHAAGYSAQEIAEFFNNGSKISESYTPHPTEHLDPDDIKLVRALVEASESPLEEREANIKVAAEAIAKKTDFGASRKYTGVDEIDSTSETSRIHNKGINQLDREIEGMIYRTTSERVNICTNSTPKRWLDADGKNTADGFYMMAEMSSTMMDAMTDLSDNLSRTMAGNASDDIKSRLGKMHENINKVINRLQPAYESSRNIVIELAQCAPEERENLYSERYSNDYKGLRDGLANVFDDMGNDQGFKFYEDTVKELGSLRKDFEDYNPESALLMDESFRSVQRCGFALDEGQMRHGDPVNINILDNLFKSDESNELYNSDEFWNLCKSVGRDLLNDLDHSELLEAGGFSGLPSDTQQRHWDKILRYAEKNEEYRTKLLDMLSRANPLAFNGGNGYPDQGRAYMDRNDLRSLFPLIFGDMIISDAQIHGAPRSMYITDLFGMYDMKHMPLFEDKENAANMAECIEAFKEACGDHNLKNRAERLEKVAQENDILSHAKIAHLMRVAVMQVMRAASDIERWGGSPTRLQAFEQLRQMTRICHDMKVPFDYKLGGGMDLNRFGGDPDMPRRIIAQELKAVFNEKLDRGEELDEYDYNMINMAMSISYTTQGRGKRYSTATAAQKTDDFAGKYTNILQDNMDLMGDVSDNTFIDEKQEFSPAMEETKSRVKNKAIKSYIALANAYGTDGKGNVTGGLLLDSFMNKVGCKHLWPFLNNSARADAGKLGGGKDVSKLRAIGKCQASDTSQANPTGIYGSGQMMERLNNKRADEVITSDDVDELVHSDEWNECIFSRNLIDAGKFNAILAFERLSAGDASEWNFDRAMDIGKECQVIKVEGEEKWKVVYEGEEKNVTDDQLYLCKLYYDRAVFLACSEAALNPDKNGPYVTMEDSLERIIQAIRPTDNNLDFGLGERTLKEWPSVKDALDDHKKQAPMYSVIYMINDDIEEKIQNDKGYKDAVAKCNEYVKNHEDGEYDEKDIIKYSEAKDAAKGAAKEAAIATYGDGDYAVGESNLRRIMAAFRTGTLSHKSKWGGEVTYGMENRNKVDMVEVLHFVHDWNAHNDMNIQDPQPELLVA